MPLNKEPVLSEHLYKLINDKNTPFLSIERLLNSQSITDLTIVESLALRKDTPQYILEWISMIVTDQRCLRAVFADRFFPSISAKDINNRYSWLVLSKRIHSYRGLSEQLMSLTRIYLNLNKI